MSSQKAEQSLTISDLSYRSCGVGVLSIFVFVFVFSLFSDSNILASDESL